jgi:hypothetical protein
MFKQNCLCCRFCLTSVILYLVGFLGGFTGRRSGFPGPIQRRGSVHSSACSYRHPTSEREDAVVGPVKMGRALEEWLAFRRQP